MNRFSDQQKEPVKKKKSRKTIRLIGFFFGGLFALLVIPSIALSVYISHNKPAIIAEINDQVNKSINGKITIGDLKFKFLTGFPNATLALKQVTLKDSLWETHQHTFLKAKEIEIRLNVWRFLNDKIDIHKIVVNEASIQLYKAKNGYTNAYLLQPKQPQTNAGQSTAIDEIVLNKVNFSAINLKEKKLFHFDIRSLKTKLHYAGDHIKTNVRLKMLVKNLIFKPKNGSFLKEKKIEGVLAVDFLPKSNLMNITAPKLKIGTDRVALKGFVNLGKYNSNFKLTLETEILWRNMTPLLTPNISKRLNRFDLKNPAKGSCIISGNWNIKGNPKLIIRAKITNNELKTPDGLITNCSFEGEYNNNYVDGKGFNDPNSVIILKNFKGIYKTIPFEMPIAKITDLKKPVASGKFKSDFEIRKMNEFINEKFLDFTAGQAHINLDFKINIVNLRINKPTFTGNVLVTDAHLEYVPKKLLFQNTDIELDFTDQYLLIKKIKFRDRDNVVFMDGKIDDFLYLYYHDNDKMSINWNIYSPNLDVRQFLSFLTKPKNTIIKKKNTDSFTTKLQTIIYKSRVTINLKADKVVYDKDMAEQVSTTIQMNDAGLKVENGKLKALGGTIDFDGELVPKNNYFTFSSQTKMQNLDLEKVLGSLNNFGLKSLKSQNIKGQISADATISGLLLPKGQAMRNSISMDIKKGIIHSLGGTITFDGQLFPKNKMYAFNFNTQINQINAVELLAAFHNFGMKSLKTPYLNGALSANTTISGQLLPNWRLYSNTINLAVSNGTLKSFGGDINFDAKLIPKNKSYAFTTNTQINKVDIEQFMVTFNYFGIKSLEKQKIKGQFSTTAVLNGTLLSSGNLLDNTLEIALENGLVKSMGGTIAFDGKLFPKNKMYDFDANAQINQVAIGQFLETFDNFGITSFQPENIKGQLNSTASIHGVMKPGGVLVTNAITGNVSIDISDGSLEDFEPIKKVWKFIFPFRDFDNITFSSITGDLKIIGDKVNVNNFKVSSNVLNFDMEGIYAFKKGTNLALTVPLRNPKKDEKIDDVIKKIKKRDNGIVLHLVAVDGEDGKIKIKWNKKHKKENN